MIKNICTEPSCVFFGRYCRIEGHVNIQYKKPGIAKVASERKELNKEYERVKKEFLRKHKACEVCNDAPATDLHHKRGRNGKLLTDARYFLATCRPCHDHIHNDIPFSRANGFIESRHKKENV